MLKQAVLLQSGKMKKLTAIFAGSVIFVKGSLFLNDDEGDQVVDAPLLCNGITPGSMRGVSHRTSATFEHSVTLSNACAVLDIVGEAGLAADGAG